MKIRPKKCLQALLPALLLWAPALVNSARSISRLRARSVAVKSEIALTYVPPAEGEPRTEDPFAVFGDSAAPPAVQETVDDAGIMEFLRRNDLLAGKDEQVSDLSGDIGRKAFAGSSPYNQCQLSWGTYNTHTSSFITNKTQCTSSWGGTWIPGTTAPVFESASVPSKTATSFDIAVDLNQASTVYAALLPAGATAPSSAQVVSGTDGDGNAAIQTENLALTSGSYTGTITFNGVAAGDYRVYLVGENSGSEMTPTPEVVDPAFEYGTVFSTDSYYVWPQVATSANGNIYMLFWDNANYKYTVDKWNEGTLSWSSYASFTSANTGTYQLSWGGYNRAAFAASSPSAGSDDLHVVFGAGSTVMANTYDPYYGLYNGSSWSFTKMYDDVDQPDDFDIALDGNGKAYVSYTVDSGGSAYYLRYETNGSGSFLNPATTLQSNSSSLELGQTFIDRESGGTVHIFYGSEQDPWHMGYYTADSSDGFSNKTLVLDSCSVASCPSDSTNNNRIYYDIGNVIIDSADTIHMVYTATPYDSSGNATVPQAYYRTYHPSTDTWDAPTDLTTAGLSDLKAYDLKIVGSTVYVLMGSDSGYYFKAYDGSNWFDGKLFSADGIPRQFVIDPVTDRVMIAIEKSSKPYEANYKTGLISDFVTLTPPNVAPTFVGSTTTLSVASNSGAHNAASLLHISDSDTGQTETWTQGTAPTHGTLTISGATAASGGTDIAPGGTVTYAPAAGYYGSDGFSVQVSDGTDTASRTITVAVQQAPAVTSGASTTFTAGTAGTFAVTASGFPVPTLSETGSLPVGMTFANNGNGSATLAGTPAAGSGGSYTITIGASNGIGSAASQIFTLKVDQAPAVTSGASTTFTAGTAGSFSVTATGYPVPTLSETGSLPAGVSFTDNGGGSATLAGTPAAGSGGRYTFTIGAGNGVGSTASQSFTLNVDQAPAVTSGTNTTFTAGTAGSFSVTAGGYPVPTLSETGSLPAGVTFTDNGDGTATLAGTPAAGSGGSYNFTIGAGNGVGSNASQSFTLTVGKAPVVSSTADTTFTAGTAGSFSVTATGYPVPTLSETGSLPAGVTFTDNGDGTATLAGTPAAGSGGSYTITIGAGNGIGSAASQSFTLKVDQAPAVISGASTTFTAGTAGSFFVTAGGFPAPTLSETGILPAGVTFTDNGDGTATLAGTPAAGSSGSYAFTIGADNGIGSSASQSFTLTVDQAPAVTSGDTTTFTTGKAGSFMVTASGYPTPVLRETGGLPGGVTFTDNHNGTATLTGTPSPGSDGSYTLTIGAINGVGSDAGQNFTLTISAVDSGTPSAVDTNIAVSPDRRLFGVETIGDCAASPAVPFTVTNMGRSVLNIGTLDFGGNDSSQFSLAGDDCSGATLNPGDSCTVQVKFCPTSTGSKAATLQIPSDAPNTPVLNALLYNEEPAGEEAARRMPPILDALSIPEVITGGKTYTITWSLLGYDSDYLSRIAIFNCTGAAAGTCGESLADSFADSGDLSAIGSDTGTWSYDGMASKKLDYSYTFTVPGVTAATPIVIRFYQKSRSDAQAGLDSLSLIIPGNLVSAGTGYYDAQGRRLSHTIAP